MQDRNKESLCTNMKKGHDLRENPSINHPFTKQRTQQRPQQQEHQDPWVQV